MKKIKKFVAFIMIGLLMLSLCACSGDEQTMETAENQKTVTSDTENVKEESSESGLTGKSISVMTPYLSSPTTNNIPSKIPNFSSIKITSFLI